jgi:hypothetical protein
MRKILFVLTVILATICYGSEFESAVFGFSPQKASSLTTQSAESRILVAWSITRKQKELAFIEGNLALAEMTLSSPKPSEVAFIKLRRMKGSLLGFVDGSKVPVVKVPVGMEPLSSGGPSLHEIPVGGWTHGPAPLIVAFDLPAQVVRQIFSDNKLITRIQGVFKAPISMAIGDRSKDFIRLEATFVISADRQFISVDIPAEDTNFNFGSINLGISQKPNHALEPTSLLVTPRAYARVAPSKVVAHL